MKSSIKRLAKDHVALRKDLPPNYLFEETGDELNLPDDLTQLLICLTGPEGTPYSQGLWNIRLSIPLEYPQSPPTATFKTRIFHPNVAEETGAVCLETLKRDWDPKLTLKDILVTISCLLIQPNPDSALNQKAGALIQQDYDAFARQAKLMTRIHAPIPGHLHEAAIEAKRRGEDVAETRSTIALSEHEHTDNLQENQSSQIIPSNKAEKEPKALKRPLAEVTIVEGTHQDDPISECSSRRKSPKHRHITEESLLPSGTLKSATIGGKLSQHYGQKSPVLPVKVVFQAHWSVGAVKPVLRTKARIGIRRL